MNKSIKPTLPEKPSELLKLAMLDLELVEKDPRYEVNMGLWHQPIRDVCHVCLAGSVMAKTLDAPIDQEHFMGSLKDQTLTDKLKAIDLFRCGSLTSALYELNTTASNLPSHYNEDDPDVLPEDRSPASQWLGMMSTYNRKEWKLHMATIIGILEAEGL